MKPSRILLPAVGALALLAVTSSAQHQAYDKTTPSAPPAKGGVAVPPDSSETPRSDRPSTVPREDRLTTDATRFKALDTDGDNRISRSEFTLAANQQFQTGSPGNAGQVTGEARRSQGTVAAGTTDGNFTSPGVKAELFDRIDTDKDGFLSQAELAMHHGNRPPK